MASFTACFHRLFARPALLIKPTVSVSAPVLGLPPIKKRKGGVRCSMEPKQGNVSSVGG
ncbi:hypothetical protein F2Q70_00028141 [Brassica cretica]|uniref:PSII 6.1 kDa protein n=1 Tax=Brassica cretica TaxID=69181 RepID=A0A8S9LGN9_BRACR|nr:hypothetical protein F2Q68_00027713 [Brassica cretica]KAF2605197.1 hypothetical protein F2Q70_00028141 [Brassica cretica]